jgi:ferredoxin-NADP reductase
MKTYQVTILKKEIIATKTVSFYLSKPKNLIFKAGQYLKLSLINPQMRDARGNIRSFSIASLPEDDYLMVTMRIRKSPFKTELNTLPMGAEVEILAPITMFNLKVSDKPVVFLCGGIGVAAAKPMILEALNRSFNQPLYLFNSNRTSKDIPYFEELTSLKSNNFHYIPTLSKKGKANAEWQGEKGYIDMPMLQKYLSEPKKCLYFLIGPSSFMWGMYKLLQQLEISERNINFDEFTGY